MLRRFFLKCWEFIRDRNLWNVSPIRVICKFIMIPFLVQLVFTFIMVAYSISNANQQKIIDLTWDFNEDTLYWTGFQKFIFTKKIASYERGFWYAANEFQASEHGGTHLDAPYHFNKDGWKIAEIPTERFFVNAILVDFSSEVVSAGPDYIVDTKLLENKIKAFEPISNNTVLLIKFGWSKYWPDKELYMRLDENQTAHFPGLDNSSASYIAKDERIIGIGVDTSSADVGMSKTLEAHRVLLGRNMYILENIKMTEFIPEKKFTLVVAPMKLTKGSGAPVRIFAVLT